MGQGTLANTMRVCGQRGCGYTNLETKVRVAVISIVYYSRVEFLKYKHVISYVYMYMNKIYIHIA